MSSLVPLSDTRTLVRRIAILGCAAGLIPALVAGSGHAAGPSFNAPVSLKAGVSEPVIEVGPDGKVFVSGINGLVSHSPLWRSDDGGSSFKKLDFGSTYGRLPGGGDSDIVIGRDKRVYFLDLWAGSNSLARSEDNGQTWVEGTPFTTVPLSDRQWIALGNRDPQTQKDTVYVVYHFIQPPQSLAFSRSRDGGLTWEWQTLPVGASAALPGQIIADGDFVGFNYHSGNNMHFVYSNDAGTTWSKVKVTDMLPDVYEESLTAVTMDPANTNNLAIAWISRYDNSVEVSHSTDRGLHWTFPVTISSDGNSNIFPWIDARAGKIAVAWYGASQPGDPNAVTGTWRVKYAESLDGGETFTPPADATSVVKTGFICTKGVTCTGGRETGDFLQVAIDGNGMSLISYVDVAHGSASIVKQR